MNDYNCIDLSSPAIQDRPFPHFNSDFALNNGIEKELFDWFGQTEEWILSQTDFYEQFEFSFLSVDIPKNLECLISENTITFIKEKLKNVFSVESLGLVGVMAHKLTHGQRIGIHNDFINGDETHRLVIHINPDWREENGGLLMLFNSSNAEEISKIITPLNNSAFGFEISRNSHHAVSKIYGFSRYTIVYTFKKN
jgi:Rps23 Pro-64 3,4-dihydroxylase Tpa1-like proline 4-hydroxylase